MENPNFSLDKIIYALYRSILNREPDAGGYNNMFKALNNGLPLENAIRSMLSSSEYSSRQSKSIAPPFILPDLTQKMPDYYYKEILENGNAITILNAKNDSDFYLLERLIWEYRYYDSGGVWSPKIDLDKRVTSALVQGLGATSCLELGCFSGPVLSLLKEQNVNVVGIEASHLAFVLAYPNIRNDILYGDLLSININQTFDVFLAMDIIEHLNPLKLDKYIERIDSLIKPDGYVYLNSPMFGYDKIFGEPFPTYIPEWEYIGGKSFWRHIHCDELGWPMHGHLIWASPIWWEAQFAKKGLIRDYEIEKYIQYGLNNFFKIAPGRKSIFILKKEENKKKLDDVLSSIKLVLSKVEGLNEI